MAPDEATVGRIFREESGRSVATLIRVFGDIDLAEDAVQEAFAVALDRWPADGIPTNPGGWITTTARNRAIDRLRRATRGAELMREVAVLTDAERGTGDLPGAPGEPVGDDRLRLIFTCCHPALSVEARIALTLRLLGGLSTAEVARSFLVAEPTMAQRLVRAKRKIKATGIPYRVPPLEELPDRLHGVLTVLYLVYNAGADGRDEELRGEAIRLTRLLRGLLTGEAEVAGLLALLLLSESRQAARSAPDGSLAVLADQDRARWDAAFVEEGLELVRACLREDRPGPFQIQAAINAVHADAPTFADTDWPQILALYDQLFAFQPTAVVAMNRAIALGEAQGPAAALAILETLDLPDYFPWHAAVATFRSRLGDDAGAVSAYAEAARLAPPGPERGHLVARARDLGRDDTN